MWGSPRLTPGQVTLPGELSGIVTHLLSGMSHQVWTSQIYPHLWHFFRGFRGSIDVMISEQTCIFQVIFRFLRWFLRWFLNDFRFLRWFSISGLLGLMWCGSGFQSQDGPQVFNLRVLWKPSISRKSRKITWGLVDCYRKVQLVWLLPWMRPLDMAKNQRCKSRCPQGGVWQPSMCAAPDMVQFAMEILGYPRYYPLIQVPTIVPSGYFWSSGLFATINFHQPLWMGQSLSS